MELWNEIDLTRHGVIEAHAGTGKTYTIVKLVLRMLETATVDGRGGRRLLHLRELLLVTFTEKAAGELKKRIREGLEARTAELRSAGGGQYAPLIDHLENCLNNLHEALIGTIHAVCLRLLQNRPFESGVHFDTEMIDDNEGLASCLREAMRSDWQKNGTRIATTLGIVAQFGKRLESSHFTLIIKTARELLDLEHTTLFRPVSAPEDLSLYREELLRFQQQKEAWWPDLRTAAGELADLLEAAEAAGLIDNEKKKLLSCRCRDLRKIHAGYRPNLPMLANPLKVGTKLVFTRAELKKSPGLVQADLCSIRLAANPFIAASKELDTRLHRLLLTVICDAAELLAARWSSAKLTNGDLSFLDILGRMHDAVRDKPLFTATLRERIRYAIIDEFQDTSPTQWAIFRRLFIDKRYTGASRLYVVGDPKQSIYRFQGADVDSYLEARITIQNAGGAHYALLDNFRSLEAIIDGYNAVFTSRIEDGDWFLSDDGHEGIGYGPDDAVKVFRRETPPAIQSEAAALQVMALSGTAQRRTRAMAELAAQAIRRLLGKTISLPDGSGWKQVTLGYEHFAVIVEKHALTEPFLDEFSNRGIPAVKYKMEGVFQSPMAGALLALIRAIIAPNGNQAPRIEALLTHFFNRKPASINPDHDLEPCPDATCHGDDLCIAHALQEWTALAERNRWARLFDTILERTGIRERLIRLEGGERHLADLRQLIDYCLEKLYAERFTLRHLAEHLDLAARKSVGVDRDADLHVLATQKSCVKVLTMHAAKGLEFPVVFVVSGTSKQQVPRGPDCIRWGPGRNNGVEGGSRINITPYLSTSDADFDIGDSTPKTYCLEQVRRERRRLLYVALTRAQAMLFVPLHLKEPPEVTVPGFRWRDCRLPPYADNDLTPVLLSLLDTTSSRGSIGLFYSARENGNGSVAAVPPQPPVIVKCPDPTMLNLASRVCRQTSYSQLSRETAPARAIDRSEELDDELPQRIAIPSPLPGGKQTGDALHVAIEEILSAENAASILHDTVRLSLIVEKYLRTNGILTRLKHNSLRAPSPDPIPAAIATACTCIQGALSAALPLPGGGTTIIAPLPCADRMVEMEFLFPTGKHWVHGFMDLVFRIATPGDAAHPWRYFVLDWKSDTLDIYDEPTIRRCMVERHYNLQSQLYCHALDRFLRHTLREDYDPALHLGGAVYVFLRGYSTPSAAIPVFVNKAQPERDRAFIDSLIFRKDGSTYGT